MYRSASTHAIVIRRERLGEFHKNVVLLTSDLGLVRATAYGAYKMQSHLRLGSEPFTHSRVVLYTNPVSKSSKVMELEIRETFPSLPADLSRLAAASLWAEVVIKSFGAGEVSDRLFHLLLDSLRLLDASDARRQPYLVIQFLWRFLALAGYQPDIRSCERCGAPLGEGAPAFHAPSAAGFLCAPCGRSGGNLLPAGALRYLAASQSLPIERAADIQLEPDGLRSLRVALPEMVQSVIEGELTSLRCLGAAT